MNLIERYMADKTFSVLVIVKNDYTNWEVCRCYYDQCHIVKEETTGYTGIKDKAGNFYITYERLRYTDEVYFNPDNQLLTITFKAKS